MKLEHFLTPYTKKNKNKNKIAGKAKFQNNNWLLRKKINTNNNHVFILEN